MNPPCMNCAERSVTCHAACERYGEYRREIDSRSAEARKADPAKEFISDSYARARGAGKISFYDNRRRIELNAERRLKAYAKNKAGTVSTGRTDRP